MMINEYLFYKIFEYLDLIDIFNFAKTNKQNYKLYNDFMGQYIFPVLINKNDAIKCQSGVGLIGIFDSIQKANNFSLEKIKNILEKHKSSKYMNLKCGKIVFKEKDKLQKFNNKKNIIINYYIYDVQGYSEFTMNIYIYMTKNIK